jgi:hypothetical protein
MQPTGPAESLKIGSSRGSSDSVDPAEPSTSAMSAAQRYTHQEVRSKPVLMGFVMVILAESVALHAFLYRRTVIGSIALLLGNAFTIWWLVRDYQAIGEEATVLDDEQLRLRIGKRASCVIRLEDVVSASRPTWQQVPSEMVKGYLNLSGFEDPNVLIEVREPVAVQVGFGIARRAKRLGLRFDSADAFVTDLNGRRLRLGEGRQA